MSTFTGCTDLLTYFSILLSCMGEISDVLEPFILKFMSVGPEQHMNDDWIFDGRQLDAAHLPVCNLILDLLPYKNPVIYSQ